MNAIARSHTPRTASRTARRRPTRNRATGRRRRGADNVRLSRNARTQRRRRAGAAAAAAGVGAVARHSGPVSGAQLARDAQRIAQSGVAGRGRNCFRGVKYAMARQGVQLHGVPAYTAAGQLARNGNFREVQVGRDGLRNLPAGATVVWAPHGRNKYGHVSIALGNGREASDVLRNQITNYGSSFRVFLPRQQ
jgi:hypothetical protein